VRKKKSTENDRRKISIHAEFVFQRIDKRDEAGFDDVGRYADGDPFPVPSVLSISTRTREP
jgi:hypothetical protein